MMANNNNEVCCCAINARIRSKNLLLRVNFIRISEEKTGRRYEKKESKWNLMN